MLNRYLYLIFVLLIVSINASGEKQVNSPYSRFNLGSIEPAASFKSLGMGGIGIGVRSNSSIFFANPASYSSIDTNSFVFDIGVDYSINKISDGVNSFTSEDMNFDHLIIGFPLHRKVGFAFGIVPVSNGYYKLSEAVLKDDPDYDPLIGEYTSVHNGEGGFNNLFVGTGIRITKNISIGVNMSLLFGQVKRNYQVTFDDYTNSYQTLATEKLEMHGINFDYGLHYTADLSNDYFFNAGISASTGKNYNSDYEQFAYRYTGFNTRDTISFVSDDSSEVYIPGTLGVGFTIGKKNKFTAGFDFKMTKWSKSIIPGPADYAADSKSFRFGLEYIPDKYSNYSLMKRIEYRLGAHLGDSYLKIHDEQIREYGFSCGFGIPMRRTFSRTNFFFDYTRKEGSGTSIQHIEHFFTMGISLNLYDFWFIKRKYD